MKCIEVFGCPMDVATMDDSVCVIADRVEQKHFTQHVVVNIAKIVNMKEDSEFDASVRTLWGPGKMSRMMFAPE